MRRTFFVSLGCFWAYIGQPHDHIGWAAPMPFASINLTHPRTNPRNFRKKYWELTKPWKWLLFSFLVFGYWVVQKIILNSPITKNKTSFSSSANSQYFFMKISGIGPWVSKINWCERHWCGSIYMVIRLSDISTKTG